MGTTVTPIGIEISGRTVRVVQLRREGVAWRMLACAVFPRLESGALAPEDEAARIAGVVSRRGFCGGRVALAAPDERMHAAVLELPPRASGAPVEQIARMEMARLFKRDPGAMEVGLWDLPVSVRQSAGQQGMAVACAHDDVGPLLDAFEARDLSVRAIVPRMCGMLRACRPWLAPVPQVSFVMDLGWSVVRLIAVREGVIVSERTIDGADFRGLRAEAEKATAMPPEVAEFILDGDAAVGGEPGPGPDGRIAGCLDRHAERIAEQVNVSLAYIGHRYGVGSAGRVLLVGEHGATPGLAARIGALLGAECRAVTPGDIAVANAGAECGGTAATVAAGVALLAQEERA